MVSDDINTLSYSWESGFGGRPEGMDVGWLVLSKHILHLPVSPILPLTALSNSNLIMLCGMYKKN